MGLSENRVYSQWNSHLIGIMISKTIGYNGVLTIFRHTQISLVLIPALIDQSFQARDRSYSHLLKLIYLLPWRKTYGILKSYFLGDKRHWIRIRSPKHASSLGSQDDFASESPKKSVIPLPTAHSRHSRPYSSWLTPPRRWHHWHCSPRHQAWLSEPWTYPLVMTNVAIENDPIEIVDFPIKNWWIFQ